MTNSSFDLEEALIRQHRLECRRRMRRRLRFRLRTLVLMTVLAALLFAAVGSWGAALLEELRFRFDYFAAGMADKTLADVFVGPILILSTGIGAYAVVIFFVQRIRRRH